MEPSFLVFLIPIGVGIGTQAVKFAIFTAKHGWKPEYMFTHGHMPSAHTAFAVSLATSVGWYEGVGSGSFAVAAALAFILVDDAARIRMHLGDQGRYLNMLVEQLDLDESKFPRLKERVGHRVSEVVVGALIGLLATLFLAATL
ncbi:MAG: divergent PAP2 family protein [Candidatus Moranbacteria bacterium]|nr:divergent PAP2 family protein [Candidatus Moranbacteria bacterium]NTW46273.1 divergent PAP2 family protein [Candidatus Moranbacteria bacterium]